MRVATNIKESQRLMSAGLSPKSADMYWGFLSFGDIKRYEVIRSCPELDAISNTLVPAWSLYRLLEIRVSKEPFNYGAIDSTDKFFDVLINSIIDAIGYGWIDEKYIETHAV